jgi:hypothetical protein
MHQIRTLRVLNTFPALTAMAVLAACEVASAASPATTASLSFSYSSGFTGVSGAFGTGASTTFSGSVIDLIPGPVVHQAGSVWYKTQQNIQSFTTDFTFQITPAVASIPAIAGMAFVVQNTNSTTNPLAYGSAASADANLDGYGAYTGLGPPQYPLYNSIAVKFDISGSGQRNYPSGGSPNATGLYINGGPWAGLTPQNDLNPTGINLNLGHVMDAHMVYDGSLLTMVLKDTVTNAQARYTWPVNIPAATGSSSAWIGLTAGQVSPEAEKVLTWSYWTGYNTRLATPTFSVAAGSYPSAQSVSISGPAGATIYYTTNGLPPTSSSTQYTGPITVSSSEVVQAVAIESNFTDSLVAAANYQIAPSGTPMINFAGGFANATDLVIPVGYAKFSGSTIQLTDTNSAGLEAGAAWYAAPVDVTGFTTNFTLQFTNASANGMTFCIQNQNPASSDASSLYVSGGPTAIGNNMSGLGYSGSTGGVGGQISGLLSSVAIKFDLYNSPGNTTGLYTNGADLTGAGQQITITGVNLNSGHPLNVSLTYSGTTLAMKITDTVTGGVFSHSWTINIPTTVGGNTAYVGFTGATGGQFANQYVQAWTYAGSGQSSTGGAAPTVPDAPTNVTVQ